jgi:hypothetical protein
MPQDVVNPVAVDADGDPIVSAGEGAPVGGGPIERELIGRKVVGTHLRRVGMARAAEIRDLGAPDLSAKPGAVRGRHGGGGRISPMARDASDLLPLVDAALELNSLLRVAHRAEIAGVG